ncbi:hypothetical protein ACQB60_04785 [Actinomycetota bacterium Odt1-20B]
MNSPHPLNSPQSGYPRRRSTSFRTPAGPGRPLRRAAAVAVPVLIPVLVLAGGDAFRAALDFTTGVLSLVSLTASVAWGLVATDRLFLRSRQRLLAQAVHRATAVAAIGFLLLHGTVKLALGHVSLVGALVPFGLGVTGSAGLIGLGALAGLLMVLTGITGALRSAFAAPAGVASRWRSLHMLAYPAWCAALVHGLYAGRPPKPWVIALYCLCLAGVAGAVVLRGAPLPVKRKVAARVLALLEPGTRYPASAPAARSTTPHAAPTPAPTQADAPADTPPHGLAAAYRALAAAPPPPAPPTARTPRWPAPSPPPPAEAPPAHHEPGHDASDTRHEPSHSHSPRHASGTGLSAPGPGEPWNASTGGPQ